MRICKRMRSSKDTESVFRIAGLAGFREFASGIDRLPCRQCTYFMGWFGTNIATIRASLSRAFQ